jgi:RHS repeat-associated protein
VDFNGSQTIDEIDVFTLQDDYNNPSAPAETMTFNIYGLTGFDVQYWNGSAWVTVPGASVAGNNKVWNKINFPAITTTKIRVLTNASGDGFSRITEVEAWAAASGRGSSAKINWLVSDHLGTPRMILDQTGSLANVSRHDYLPFGEELYAGTGGRTTGLGYSASDGVRQKFTGYEADAETDLNFAQARYQSATQGRFTSPDPTLLSVNAHNPQTWNRYSYVMNNPLAFTDPLGLWAIDAVVWYKVKGYDETGNAIFETDKKGNKIVDHVTFVAYRTKDDDDGASLAKQLGLTGEAAEKFAAGVGDQTSVQLADTSGEVKRIFGIVEELYGRQLRHEAGGNKNGPSDFLYGDCSSTSCKLAFPSEDIRGGGPDPNWSVRHADQLIRNRNLKSVSAGEMSIGDIVRYANAGNLPKHFTTFIFRDDSGVPIVFSRSGTGGPFEYGSAYSSRFQNSTYGTIRGIGKDPTGFYGRRR